MAVEKWFGLNGLVVDNKFTHKGVEGNLLGNESVPHEGTTQLEHVVSVLRGKAKDVCHESTSVLLLGG